MPAAMVLVLLVWIPPQVRAKPCSGEEQLMASIWKELSAENLSAAEQGLREMERTQPDCPEVILANAWVATAEGALAQAEAFFARYEDLLPNEATPYSYPALFLLDLGPYPLAAWLAPL